MLFTMNRERQCIWMCRVWQYTTCSDHYALSLITD